ncbi:MAG TPA: lactate 2-monooxygenase [Ktedonobacterales bacterium]|jgi:isopentenyl diphosphate isomerase/L-lactate dehydrogenase-like FMN-dependent dehydrogenase|nr:lactate 2-monooxygenase [Ktedonobacterales bacterium]
MSDPTSPMTALLARQTQIYLNGLQGRRPTIPISFEALEAQAREKLSPAAFDYIAGAAGSEDTMRANREAFARWRIVPRMLRDISSRDLHVEVLGQRFAAPIMLAPIGVLSIAHPEAEVAVARAAASLGVPFMLSTASTRPMEEVARAAGDSPRWFQLYWGNDPAVAASMVRRAEAAGYGAIVITLDTKMLSWRERDLQNAYLPFLLGEGLGNYFSDPVFRQSLAEPIEANPQAAIMRWTQIFSDPAHTWDDLAALREHTRLPILLKGILHPDDAARALAVGMDGVIVSNHGGRQLDGAIAALDALPAVVAAVGGRAPVLFDSGIRRGADVLKALALGATMTLVGRPYAYGLALAGEAGVREVMLDLLADLDVTLALTGCRSVDELRPEMLVRG